MDAPTRYSVSTPNVLHETIDGETVIINLTNGRYYSLVGMGALLWAWVGSGATADEIASALGPCFDASQKQLLQAVQQFMAELSQEGLVRQDPSPTVQALDMGLLASAGIDSRAFQPPVLHRYTDMQDLLLLDPIHEVGEDGWPVVKRDGSAGE